MNIGIDIDGVIANIEPYVFEYGSKLLYDKGRSLENIDKEKYEFHLLKKNERKIISTEYVTYELLSPDVETNIECMQMTLIGKNAETSVKPMSHKGEEIAVLLDGKVKLTIGKFSVVLSSGDSIHIPAMAPHKWTNLNDTKSVIIFSVTPPEF